MSKEVELIINTSEIGAGTRGASLGPAAIMTAARKKENTFFGQFPVSRVTDFNHFLDYPTNTPFAKRIEQFAGVFEHVATTVQSTLRRGNFPLIISGDHSSAAATIAGIKTAYPDKRLGVLWVDAHGDLHSPYTTPSGNLHGMPLSLSLADDNLEQAHNNVDDATISIWNDLKNYGGISPKVRGKDIVFIAVRDTESEEDAIIERRKILNHTVAEFRRLGVKEALRMAEEELADCDLLYVSFDVDSMDPELSSFGTGTPVGNGITPHEAKEILELMAVNPKTVCIEFVEVNPCLDNKTNAMAEITFDLIQSVANKLLHDQ